MIQEETTMLGDKRKLGIRIELVVDKGDGVTRLKAKSPFFHEIFHRLSRGRTAEGVPWEGRYFSVSAPNLPKVVGVDMRAIGAGLLLERDVLNMSWLRHSELHKGITLAWPNTPFGREELEGMQHLMARATQEMYEQLAKTQGVVVEMYLKEAA